MGNIMSQQPLTDLNLQPLLSPRETAAILGVTYETLSVWRSSGRYGLPFVKIGRRVMYRVQDVQAFIEDRLHAGQDNDQTAVSPCQEEWRGQQQDLFSFGFDSDFDLPAADTDDIERG
jgi:hypothetical protein